MSQAHSHSPHQQNIHQHVETLRSSSTTSLMANQDQNSSNGSSHRFIPNVVDPFLPAFCAQFSIVNEMPPLMFKEQPVFKTMDQSKDLYTYNLLQCPHHNEDVMKWLNCDDSNLVEGLHQILSNNPKSNEEIILNQNGALLDQKNLNAGNNSTLLNALLKYQENKENIIINPAPVSMENQKKNTSQKEPPKVTSNTTPIKVRQKRPARKYKKVELNFEEEPPLKDEKADQKPQPTKSAQPSLKTVIKADLAPKLDDNENIIGALDELFAWSDFRESEDELVQEKLLKDVEVEVELGQKNNYLKDVPTEKLTKLLNVLESQVKIGLEMLKAVTETTKEELISSLKQDRESLNISCRCAILELTVMAGKGLSKEVLLEECFDTILDFSKTILRKYIYPIVESEDILKKKSNKKFSCNSEIIHVCKIFKRLDKMLRKQKLKDEFILTISDIAVSTFFVNGIDEIQLSLLGVITKIFSSYAEHRDQILGEITVSLLRLPAHKKTDRRFRIAENSTYIQMFTSLMLQLIHSCTDVKNKETSIARKLVFGDENTDENTSDNEGEDDDIMKDDTPESEDSILESYEQAVRCATTFSEYFMERCTKSESVDGDNRLIIEHFVEDLLVVLPLPSWPGADLLLQALANVLCNKYLSQKDVADKFRQLALKILGKIAARTKELEFKNSEFMKEYMLTMGCVEDDEAEKKSQEDHPFTTPQKPKSFTESPTQKLQNEFKNLFQLDEVDKMKLSLFTYLCTQEKGEPMLAFAKQFIVCQWFYDEREIEKKAPFYKSLLSRDDSDISNSSIQASHAKDLYLNVICNRTSSVINKFDFVFGQIISELKDEKAKVRADAVKALQTVINIDSSVLMKNYVQMGIRERTLDEFPSVRECVIDLIGNAMITLKRFEDFYIRIILDRVKVDKAKSVRKRSITILGDICTHITDDGTITEICKTLATRLSHQNKEEDNIKELVLKTFTKLWFDKNTSEKLKISGLQIVDVIGKQNIDFKQYKDHWLYQIIKMSSDSKEHEKIKKSLSMIIEPLLQHIIKLAGEPLNLDVPNRSNIATCMAALHLICLADYSLLLPHFKTVSVYANSGYPGPVIFHAVSMIEKICPYINKPEPTYCTKLQKELLQTIFSSQGIKPETIDACIGCLCAFLRRTKNSQEIYKILTRIVHLMAVNETNLQNDATTARLIYAAALFCRYHDVDTITDIPENVIHPNLKPGSVATTIYSIIIGWMSQGTNLLKQKAARSIGFLLIRQPKLFLLKQSQKIISECLNSPNKELVIQVVLMFKDFLLAEESKLSAAGNQDNVDAGVTSTLMSSYIDSIIALLDDPTDVIRLATLEVLDLTVQQGLTIPSRIMKFIIAMECDPNIEIREKAHTLNLYLYDRFAKAFIGEQRHGFLLSYSHLQKINEGTVVVRGVSAAASSNDETHSVFKGAYSFVGDFPAETKKNIMCDVVKSIFNLLETSADNLALLNQVSFMIEALTFIQYKTLAEVAGMVCTIQEKLDTIGDSYCEELKTQIKKDDKNLKLIHKNIALATSLCFLIQFKNTLKIRYNLNNAKMEDYLTDPKSFQKKTISSVKNSILFDFKTTLPKLRQVLSSPVFEEERQKETTWQKSLNNKEKATKRKKKDEDEWDSGEETPEEVVSEPEEEEQATSEAEEEPEQEEEVVQVRTRRKKAKK
ncbi:hypothetical protein FDP41_005429 [Naegleria fowleri]|uniref:Sister chromatid cohesion protein n=1 Tax=Naegleria fowleri TaxID=5763 RepID=A0A6A5BPH6_NAEFO|nr:uncharacterized protein FDP41_005429 [Naegleria fowleri]KAF0975435.1 hypothetical protein FDP41_005429 [Naegleria fowleri]